MKMELVIAAVGDCIMGHPISDCEDFAPLGRHLRSADIVTGNFEGSLLNPAQLNLVPQSDFGTGLITGSPEVAADLQRIGFSILSRANNHATDFGIDGMRLTSALLENAGIMHAGVGEDLHSARSARFLSVSGLRLAFISLTSTFSNIARSIQALGNAPARPGVNSFRTIPIFQVLPEEVEMLRRMRRDCAFGPAEEHPRNVERDLDFFGIRVAPAERRGITYAINSVDEEDVLNHIRNAKKEADFLVLSMHSHEPGNWSEQPADFLPIFARHAVDAGADAFLGHGPHRIRGIEIYHDRPILYSQGNFICHLDMIDPITHDFYEQYRQGLSMSDEELKALWRAAVFDNDSWYRGFVASMRFEQSKVKEVSILPIELARDRSTSPWGTPRPAGPEVASRVLQTVRQLSEPFGTEIEIDGCVGRIRAPWSRERTKVHS